MDQQNKTTIATYNAVAQQYAASNDTSTFWKKEFDDFCRYIPGKRILEIGCGGGRDAALFLRRKFTYLGIDASRGLLRVARRRHRKAKFRVMSFYNLRFRPNYFDGVWSVATLLHARRNQLPRIMKKIQILLIPGAVALISLKQKRDMKEGMVVQRKHYATLKRYFTYYTKPEFSLIARKSGFQIIRTYRKREGENIWLSFLLKKPNNLIRLIMNPVRNLERIYEKLFSNHNHAISNSR